MGPRRTMDDDWICPLCLKKCKVKDHAVFCAKCSKWYHISCDVVPLDAYHDMSKMEQDYICRRCTCENGNFQYRCCLKRLNADMDDLPNCAKIEKILMRGHTLITPTNCITLPFENLTVDTATRTLYERFGKDQNSRRPVIVSGDGSCLFNSASVALYGHEEKATEFRARTAIELILHRSEYENKYPELKCVYDINETIRDCISFGYSSIYTMAALAQVINHPISSVYPPMNGLLDPGFRLLTKTMEPLRHEDESPFSETIYIMWTKVGETPKSALWFPNHFVPLVVDSTNQNNDAVVQFDSSCDSIVPLPTQQYVNSSNTSDLSVPDPSEHDDDIQPDPPEHNDDVQPQDSGITRNVTSFMTVRQAFDVLKSERQALSKIPTGNKANSFFVLDNSSNEDKRSDGQKSDFTDDMGVWDSKSTSTKKTEFLYLKGALKLIEKYKGRYYYDRRKVESLVDPQPAPDDICTIKRYHATLKRDTSVKKHITWIEKAPPTLLQTLGRAIFEYIGHAPDGLSIHGNSKKENCEYIRTPAVIKEKIKEAMKSRAPPTKTYTDMVLNNSTECPRDTKQMYNFKQNTKEAGHHCQNSADYIQIAISDFSTNNFIQHIVPNKKIPPSFVLYYEQQLQDLIRFCSTESEWRSPLGVDRTFNLGQCFVTCLVYRNHRLIRKVSNEAPIFLGPVFLHFDGKFETYHSFFSHIQVKLENMSFNDIQSGMSNLIFGSDEERALMKAITTCFPQSNTLCALNIFMKIPCAN